MSYQFKTYKNKIMKTVITEKKDATKAVAPKATPVAKVEPAKTVKAVEPKEVKAVAPVSDVKLVPTATKSVPVTKKPETKKEVAEVAPVEKIWDMSLVERHVRFEPNSIEYMQYQRLSENRELNKAHVAKLIGKFKKSGNSGSVLKVVCITLNGKDEYFVVDGEHSRTASFELGLPMNVLVFRLRDNEQKTLVDYISEINSNSKSWSNTNILEAYAKLGITEYIEFQAVKKTHGLELGDLLTIFVDYDGTHAKNVFASGAMKFNKNRNYMELLDAVVAVKQLFPRGSKIRRAFFKFCKSIHNETDGKKGVFKGFAQAIIDSKIVFSGGENEVKAQLEPIYNKFMNK